MYCEKYSVLMPSLNFSCWDNTVFLNVYSISIPFFFFLHRYRPDVTFAVEWALKTNYLPYFHPDVTFAVEWALKTNALPCFAQVPLPGWAWKTNALPCFDQVPLPGRAWKTNALPCFSPGALAGVGVKNQCSPLFFPRCPCRGGREKLMLSLVFPQVPLPVWAWPCCWWEGRAERREGSSFWSSAHFTLWHVLKSDNLSKTGSIQTSFFYLTHAQIRRCI